MSIEDLAFICSRVANEINFEFQIGLRTKEETDKMADRATVEALKLELAIKEN